MDRRVTPPKRVTSPTWDPPLPSLKERYSLYHQNLAYFPQMYFWIVKVLTKHINGLGFDSCQRKVIFFFLKVILSLFSFFFFTYFTSWLVSIYSYCFLSSQFIELAKLFINFRIQPGASLAQPCIAPHLKQVLLCRYLHEHQNKHCTNLYLF